jgi:hypothetical protein
MGENPERIIGVSIEIVYVNVFDVANDLHAMILCFDKSRFAFPRKIWTVSE